MGRYKLSRAMDQRVEVQRGQDQDVEGTLVGLHKVLEAGAVPAFRRARVSAPLVTSRGRGEGRAITRRSKAAQHLKNITRDCCSLLRHSRIWRVVDASLTAKPCTWDSSQWHAAWCCTNSLRCGSSVPRTTTQYRTVCLASCRGTMSPHQQATDSVLCPGSPSARPHCCPIRGGASPCHTDALGTTNTPMLDTLRSGSRQSHCAHITGTQGDCRPHVQRGADRRTLSR
ncbi:hypothetical protein O3P69_004910 [Scylla paramamosain]|uniref:Uncharacterized protein n=1 Tax=Scylla paramamosain TaxID=85552 RepID=A0AAW0UH10_SCYPA